MKEKRVGIVGCGAIARYHLEGYEKNGVKPACFTDENREAAAELARDFPHAEIFPDAASMIESGKAEAISVCTPPAFHEEIAVHALNHGVHVLCEKPFAHTLDSARRIAAAADESSALLMCGFRHRFLPAMRVIHGLLPEIGPVVLFSNTFGGPLSHLKDRWFSRPEISGGGALIDTASHSIDLFRFLTGEIASSSGMTGRRLPEIEVEDTGILTLRSEEGCLGAICATWMAGVGVALLDIVGEKGRLVYDYTQPADIRLRLAGEDDWKTVATEPGTGFAEMIGHFFGAIDGRWPLTCTAEDGLKTIEVLDGVYAGNKEIA